MRILIVDGHKIALSARLRSAVSICLLTRFPIVMPWGPKLSKLSNDAHISFSFLPRVKHPAFLARSFAARSSQCR